MPNIGSRRVAGLLPSALIRTHGSRWHRRLYLTFDDGPDPAVTDGLRELLTKHEVLASFFCIGENVERHPDVVQRLAAAGHAVCNHSHTHRNFRRLSTGDQFADLRSCADAIAEACGEGNRTFRAPQGQLAPGSLLRMRRKGWTVVHWSYDSLDYRKPSCSEQIRRFEEKPVRNGDIILFHDDNELCISVLDELLPRWRALGFSFGSVTELL